MGEVATIERPAKTVAPLRAGGNVMAIIPQTMDEVWRMAMMAVTGKMAPASLIEKRDPNEATSACCIAIMAGAELGLTPLMALRSYAVVNGRPSLWGDGLKAVVRQSGRCEYIRAGSDSEKGWCEAKRSDTGEVQRKEFTLEQAKRAGLADKTGPWKQYPDMMMERRATSRCLNDLFADVLGGIVDQQEALDSDPVDVASVRSLPPSPPPAPDETDAPIIDEEPNAITGESDFDLSSYLEQLEGSMAVARDLDTLEEAWIDADPEGQFANDPDNLGICVRMKDRNEQRIAALKAPSPTASSSDVFPGDEPMPA